MNDLFSVKGKVVVVTGGAGILGASICSYLAEQGTRVVVLDRDERPETSWSGRYVRREVRRCFS